MFIDAGIVTGEKSAAFKEKQAKLEEKRTLENAKYVYTNIYDNIDKIDVEALCRFAGYDDNAPGGYPSQKSQNVEIDGKIFNVQFGLKRTVGRLDWVSGYDARKEYDTMLSREEVQNRIIEEDPGMHSDAAYFATPEFLCENALSEDELKRRIIFLKAVGASLSKPEVLKALVEYIPKKKNGTFNRSGFVRIASSMVANSPNIVIEIVGKCKSDDTVYLSFEQASVDSSNLGKSQKDFISAYWKLFGVAPKAKLEADHDTEEITITYDKYKVKVTAQAKGDDWILAGISLSSCPFLNKITNRSWEIVEEKLIPDVIRNFNNGEIRFETGEPYLYSTRYKWSELSKRKIALVTKESAAHIRELRSKPGYLKDGMFANTKLLAEVKKYIAEDGFSFDDTVGAILGFWNSFASMDPSLFTSVLETFPRKKDGSLFADRKAILPISSDHWFVDIDRGSPSTYTEISFHIWGDGGIHI